jgi:ABC-type Na+ efflux pump permease subunit
VWALFVWLNWRPAIRLEPWQARGIWFLILGGLAGFGARTLLLLLRLLGPAPNRPFR